MCSSHCVGVPRSGVICRCLLLFSLKEGLNLTTTEFLRLFVTGEVLLRAAFVLTVELFCLQSIRQEKKSTKIKFLGSGDRPVGWGSSTRRGWWPKTSCPPSKLCLPWVSKRGIRDVPGILPGCPGPLAVFKKFVQKKLRAHFFVP